MNLLAEVHIRVQSSSHVALDRALSILDKRLSELEAASTCSYALYLNEYVNTKLLLRHIDFQMERLKCTEEMFRHREALDIKVRLMAGMKYTNVCFKCQTCKGRNKAWPDSTGPRSC